jgi:anti-sigma regulatory factor (Ser/Thr protein kinase)
MTASSKEITMEAGTLQQAAGEAVEAPATAAEAAGGEPQLPELLARAGSVVRAYAIREWSDVAIARHQARRLAREHGFEPRRAGELAIVVSELASNIVKYGVRGEIALHLAAAGAAEAAVTVVARDVGPPIHDLPTAMLDGHDDHGPIDPATLVHRGGLGTGLGAVARLADRLEIRQEGGGKQIIATFSRAAARGA